MTDHIYRHYRNGKKYVILLRGKLESSEEKYIVYRENGNDEVWIRPESEFFGLVYDENGIAHSRFDRIR